jgi:hypothetical protein
MASGPSTRCFGYSRHAFRCCELASFILVYLLFHGCQPQITTDLLDKGMLLPFAVPVLYSQEIAGPSLRVISTMSVGYGAYERHTPQIFSLSLAAEHIDLSTIAQRGIKLGYTPDVLTDAGI